MLSKKQKRNLAIMAILVVALLIGSGTLYLGGQENVRMSVSQFYENGQNYAEVSMFVTSPYAEDYRHGQIYHWIVFKNKDRILEGNAPGTEAPHQDAYSINISVAKGDKISMFAQWLNQYDVAYSTCSKPVGCEDCNPTAGSPYYNAGACKSNCLSGFVSNWDEYAYCAKDPYNLNLQVPSDYKKCAGCANPYSHGEVEITQLFNETSSAPVEVKEVQIVKYINQIPANFKYAFSILVLVLIILGLYSYHLTKKR